MKKFLSIVVSLLLIVSVLPTRLFGLTANAYTSGDFVYTVSEDGVAIITNCYQYSGKVIVPNTLGGYPVKVIDKNAFKSCTFITSITIPENMEYIYPKAFANCTLLNELNLNAVNCESSNLGGPGWTSLDTINIGSTVKILGSNMFSYCEELTHVKIPNNVTTIKDDAFLKCTALSSITIPENVEIIEEGAFALCTSLETLYLNAKNCKSTIGSILDGPGWTGLKNITIGISVESIGFFMFADCNEIKRIIMPTTIKTIDTATFYGCANVFDIWYTGSENDKNNILNNGGFNNAVWHYNTCAVEHQYFTDCDEYCDLCDWVRDINTEHSYDNCCDSSCNSCEKERVPPHSYGWEIDEPATCGENGVKHEECTTCNIKRSENTIINATGKHKYDNSCDTTCNICNYVRGITHNYEWVIDEPTTCGETGIKHEECTVCHTTRNENTSIDATGNHNYKWMTDTEPTCGKTGIKHEECTFCHTKRNEGTVIDATGDHKYDNACDTSCNICGEIRTITHDFEWVVDKSENCGKTGTKHEECSICHTKRNEGTVIDATGNHKYDNACDTSCNICGETRTITHDFEWVVDKYENCGKTGVKHEECAVCHIKRNEGTVIEATGNHNFEWVVDKFEDCGVDGEKHEECSVCHAKRNEGTVIEATGNHNYEWVIDKENGCTEDGVKHEKCTVCNAKNRENTVINATGHIYNDGYDSTCNVCQHQRQHYTITYNGNGEDGAPTKQTLYEGVVVKLPTIASDYYRLLGWSKTPNGGVDYRIGNSYTVTENVTLYAKWARHCYYCDDIGFKNITENRKVDCWTCDGTGQIERKDTTNRRCLDCGSTSYTYHSVPGNNGMYGWYYECNLCGSKDVSTGYVEKVSCTHCSGIGYKYETYSTTQVCTECNGLGFHKIPQVNAPQPQLASKTATSVTLVQFDGVDYSMDGETWQESNVFNNLTPGKEYCFFMRYKANSIHTVGSYGDRLYVTTDSLVPTNITSTKHTINGNNISKISAGTTVSSLLSGLNEGSYCKVYKGNSVVSGNTAVGTGMVVKIMDGNTVKASYTIIVTGDTNGDGAISVTDMIAIKAHILNKSTLTGVYATAANTNGDSGISITDFIQVKAKILGKGSITAR